MVGFGDMPSRILVLQKKKKILFLEKKKPIQGIKYSWKFPEVGSGEMILWLKSRGTRITCQTLQWGFDLFPEFARARREFGGVVLGFWLSFCSLAFTSIGWCGVCLD